MRSTQSPIFLETALPQPRFIRKEDVDAATLDKEKDIARARALAEGKPEKVLERIVEGRLAKFYEEVCLLEQPFIKDNTITVQQLVQSVIGKLGENITITRFARMKVGDTASAEETTTEEQAG